MSMADYLISGQTLTDIADAVRGSSGSGEPSIDPNVIDNEQEKLLIPDAVTAQYVEYIDADERGQEDQDYFNDKDIITGYDFLPNPDGVVVPTLLKSNRIGFEEGDDEYSPPDYGDPLYYIETTTINGQVYDKWQKVDQEGYWVWDDGPQMYIYTNPIVQVNSNNGEKYRPTDIPRELDELSITPQGVIAEYEVEDNSIIYKGDFISFYHSFGDLGFPKQFYEFAKPSICVLNPLTVIVTYLDELSARVALIKLTDTGVQFLDDISLPGDVTCIDSVVLSDNLVFVAWRDLDITGVRYCTISISEGNIVTSEAQTLPCSYGTSYICVDKLSNYQAVIGYAAQDSEVYAAVVDVDTNTYINTQFFSSFVGQESILDISIVALPEDKYCIFMLDANNYYGWAMHNIKTNKKVETFRDVNSDTSESIGVGKQDAIMIAEDLILSAYYCIDTADLSYSTIRVYQVTDEDMSQVSSTLLTSNEISNFIKLHRIRDRHGIIAYPTENQTNIGLIDVLADNNIMIAEEMSYFKLQDLSFGTLNNLSIFAIGDSVDSPSAVWFNIRYLQDTFNFGPGGLGGVYAANCSGQHIQGMAMSDGEGGDIIKVCTPYDYFS